MLILATSFATNVWAGFITNANDIVSGNQYKIVNWSGDKWLVASSTTNANAKGELATSSSEATIFTFTKESSSWYISFTRGGNTYYLYPVADQGKMRVSATKTAVGYITTVFTNKINIGINDGDNDWNIRYNSQNNDRFGCYKSGQDYIKLEEASDCTDPATPLAITSGASVTMGSTLSLTANAGNGGTKSWSVVAGTGSATIAGTTLTPVTPGTVTVKVHQNLNGTYCSQDAEKVVTINKRTATIVLSEAGAESSVSGTHYELDEYTLPTTAASCGDKVLVGWSTVTVDETDTKPASNYYAKGTTVTLSHGENKFYAVYATATAGAGDWELYTESTIVEGDYLIEQSDYAMENTRDSYYRVNKNYVTITNGVIVYSPSDEPWSDLTWHITPTGTSGVYTIKNGSNYLIATGEVGYSTAYALDFVASPTDGKELFSFSYQSGSSTYRIISKYNETAGVNKYLRMPGAYFACYADGTYPHLFKRGPSYSAYSTDCCEQPATALSITSANTVAMGNTITLASTGGNGGSITWTVTTGSGAGSITTGVFTPSSAGTVTIKAHQDQNTVLGTKYCAQDVEQEVTITVNTTGVEVDPTSKAIVVDETFTITPTVSPSDATDKTVSWSSNAEGKATVSSAGLVTGVAAGSATITCTTTNGSYTANCAVTVYGVTMQAKALVNEELVDIPGGTPGAPTRSGKNISPAANANNYVFDHWEISNASLGSSSTTKENIITNPTGAVTVTAVYLPGVEIRWYVNGEEWTAGGPSTSVESGTQYKDLTYPTDPTPGDACGNRFVGWTDHSMGAATGQSAPTPLLRSGNSDTTPITTAKEFHAVFADYAN